MLSDDIKQQISHIQLVTKRTLAGSSAGAIRTRLKGTGFEFDQLREYQQGDDLRFIDWNSSLRTNNVLVKSYFEERDRTVMILLDTSASMEYGSGQESKLAIGAQIAATIIYVASLAHDKVGLCLMTPEQVTYYAPVYGQQTAIGLMDTVLAAPRSSQPHALTKSLEVVLERLKKGTMLFIISDFIGDQSYLANLSWAAQKHDIIAVRCLDELEHACDVSAYVYVQDPETEEQMLINMADYNALLLGRMLSQEMELRNAGISLLDIKAQRPFIADMVQFFNQRARA